MPTMPYVASWGLLRLSRHVVLSMRDNLVTDLIYTTEFTLQ